MGQARLKQQRLEAIRAELATAFERGGQARDLTPREAARFIAERTHIAIAIDAQNEPVHLAVLRALAVLYGETLGLLAVYPNLDTTLPRPSIVALPPSARFPDYVKCERIYPQLLFAFLPDDQAHRTKVETVMRCVGQTFPQKFSLLSFPERGPIVVFDDAVKEPAMLTAKLLEQLHRGEVDERYLH